MCDLLTDERPPTEPPTAKEYTEAGLSWFDYYGGDAAAVEGAEKLKGLTSVVEFAQGGGGGAAVVPLPATAKEGFCMRLPIANMNNPIRSKFSKKNPPGFSSGCRVTPSRLVVEHPNFQPAIM